MLANRPGVRRRRREPGRADGDGRVRPRRDVGRGAPPAGSRSAASTAPAARYPGTSATRSPDEPLTRRRTTTPRSSVQIRPTATATAATPGCRWRRWCATCATASWLRSCSRSRSRSGRRSVSRCSARRRRRRSGCGDDLWQFFLSLPVIFYSSTIFFAGAWKALRAKTLDMMVLVAVAIGTASSTPSPRPSGSKATSSTRPRPFSRAFVLLGHWFEMRARGGANDAIRALLDLAPPKAVVHPRRAGAGGADGGGAGRRPAPDPPRR